jgi:hypothetical protein
MHENHVDAQTEVEAAAPPTLVAYIQRETQALAACRYQHGWRILPPLWAPNPATPYSALPSAPRPSEPPLPAREADHLACEAWNKRMLGYRGPAQPSPTLGDALNAGYLYLEVRCLGCDTHQTAALDIVRRPTATPIHEVERYRDCSQVRGYPHKRSHLVALRRTKISANDPPSTWWPGSDSSTCIIICLTECFFVLLCICGRINERGQIENCHPSQAPIPRKTIL